MFASLDINQKKESPQTECMKEMRAVSRKSGIERRRQAYFGS
jgi:hypothetical protein